MEAHPALHEAPEQLWEQIQPSTGHLAKVFHVLAFPEPDLGRS